jgi:hypothetical protein
MPRTDITKAAKGRIEQNAADVRRRNARRQGSLTDAVFLDAYVSLVTEGIHGRVWTKALQRALDEHQVVIIPPSDEAYWIDSTVVIPSERRIEATGATVRLVPEYPFIMLRNEHCADGTFQPVDRGNRDRNICIHGGCWEECATEHGERRYGESSLGFGGVQTCMLFNNVEGISVTELTFSHVMSFCMQIGDVSDGVFEDITFVSCYGDGLHINGRSENLSVRRLKGQVGDDMVALNMYDWLGSSVNYGYGRSIFIEDIHSYDDSGCKAMRLLSGRHPYADGSDVMCSIEDVYIRNVKGIFEYKLYLQTPPYVIGEKPEGLGMGIIDRVFFENIDVVCQRAPYLNDSDDTGHFGMFFFNSAVGLVSLESIRFTLKDDENGLLHPIAVGPMSLRRGDVEVFDPYASGSIDTLVLNGVSVNGETVNDPDTIIKTVCFNDVNRDGNSSGRGSIKSIIINGETV